MSGFLAVLCFCLSVLSGIRVTTIDSHAAAFRGKNIWTGGAELLHGRNRKWMYKWTDGWQMTFCITPRNHMGDTVVAQAIRTNIADSDIPYIKSKEDYEKLAVICTWFDQNGSTGADNATYAAAQTAVWAVMEDGWENGDSLAQIVNKHISGTYSRWKELKAYVEGKDGGAAGLPDWCRTSVYEAERNPQKLTLENGVWKAEFDISAAPELAALNWSFEGDSTGWKKGVSGGKMIITYEGASKAPTASLSALLPNSLKGYAKNTTSLNLYIPDGDRNKVQAMISAGPYDPKVYVKIGGTPGAAKEELELKRYRHTETFHSHYNFDLEKYCAETGQTLEGSVFSVLEAFDSSQLGDHIVPDNMAPKPAVWTDFKICAEASTDVHGYISHTDEKEYEYSKTYCDGHPEPEYMEVPEPSGSEDGTDNSEEIAAIESANEALKDQWETLVAACEEETDFHGMEPGEGLEMMLEDRDAAYEEFIQLKYDYTVEEIQARYGYILHGGHNDDEKIPVMRISSSESDAQAEEVEKRVVINENAVSQSAGLMTAAARQDGEKNSGEEKDSGEEMGSGEEKSGRSLIRRIARKILGICSEEEKQEENREEKQSGTEKNDRLRMVRASDADAAADIGAVSNADAISNADAVSDTGAVSISAATAADALPGIVPAFDRAHQNQLYSYTMESRSLTGRPYREPGSSSLPEPEEDDVEWIEPWGTPDENAYTFRISNHRTEGEIHINKRDLELKQKESEDYDSYGDTQGDASLEGAVYGLYAADDLIHPDGKTGIVYRKDELVSIAATDKNGDASFLAFTEESQDAHNGKSWVGHPLLLGNYYVKEIARSEGYELSVDGRRHPVTNRYGRGTLPVISGRADVTTPMTHPIDMHDGSWLEFDVTYQNTKDGFDILVSGFPEGSSFYRSDMKETTREEQVVVGSRQVPTGEYEKAKAGEYRLDAEGNYIQAVDEEGNPVWDMAHPAARTYYAVRRLEFYPHGTAVPQVDLQKWSDTQSVDLEYMKQETNAMLEQIGYHLLDSETGEDAPWTVLDLSGTTNQEIVEEILDWYAANSFWDSGSVHEIREENGRYQAILFHDYQRLSNQAIYEVLNNMLYVKIPVETADMGRRHMFLAFKEPDFILSGNYATVSAPMEAKGAVPFPSVMETFLSPVYRPLYEQYQEGDYRLDGQGNPIPIYKTEFIYGKKEETTSDYELFPLKGNYDAASGTYEIHVENTVDWNITATPVTETFRAAAGKTAISIDGTSMFYSDYLINQQGAGASAHGAVLSEEDSYAELLSLTYPGQISPWQDGTGIPGKGTRLTPIPLQERIIKQSVKVTKALVTDEDGTYPNNTNRIHGDWFTKIFGGFLNGGITAKEMSNFRFKIYLKNNLKRLYRDEEGTVVWTDRRGDEIDIAQFRKANPSLVPDIYTKVSRKTTPLYKNSDDAITANNALYGYSGGFICDEQNPGYTSILEDDNYEKFFDAIQVANQDKWDDQSPFFTSFRPIGNGKNRTANTIDNSKASDNVRQFAIRWYLDDQVKKQTEKGTESAEGLSYGDELYDEALCKAIEKADNYLKPFFAYDFDEIYAILWDREEGGGKDKDKSTVSADSAGDGFYYGISEYLPYGTYVAAEQQPLYPSLQDLKNRHFQTDAPKEISVPSVYANYEAALESPEGMSGYYRYDAGMTLEEMAKRYRIRFGEENKVIKAHNYSGDFEIYPYGMELGRIKNGEQGTDTAKEGDYFALTQSPWKPYKNYYNEADNRKAGDVPYYLAEGLSGRTPVSRIYCYSSVSEQAKTAGGVLAMEGMQTIHGGQYAPALVPWSMEIPEDEKEDGKPELSGESSYRGFAWVNFRNDFYSARLRIEKLDSETHENLLHDSAIFRIYAAERDASEDGTGNVKFYEKDTVISGSREFLESMGAAQITPMARNREIPLRGISAVGTAVGKRYTGVVPAGTPVCREEEMIWLTDRQGQKVGEFHAYTTERDGQMETEWSDRTSADVSGLSFADQNTGYLDTPEPLGAGAYVLAEVKAPAGYVRTRPIAIEIYSDKVTYYKEGKRQERVAAAIYEYRKTQGQVRKEEQKREQEQGQAQENRQNEKLARIYVENAPTRLKAEKQKEASLEHANTTPDKTVTWKVGTRVDGTLVQIGNNPDYEYAYQNGEYQGYAWKKGTLEYLNSLKAAGEDVDIVYHGNLFAGYGYITRKLETADDQNSYVAGATMTLFEAIPLNPSGDTQDLAYEGLKIVRAVDQTVTRMYVEKGYGGTHTEMVQILEGDEAPFWTARQVEREDTDILYYDLGSLDMFGSEAADGSGVRYGYDRKHRRIPLKILEDDRVNHGKAHQEYSIFAFRQGMPYLELVGTDFTSFSYSPLDKRLKGTFARLKRSLNGTWSFSEGAVLYHLDRDGNRDSLVDPETGMAYVLEEAEGAGGELVQRILVWPVKLARDEHGAVTARDKITTFRIATVGEKPDGEEGLKEPESGYITGSWEPEAGEESHRTFTVKQNQKKQNLNGEQMITDNSGFFQKSVGPVLDEHGMVQYYSKSGETYHGTTVLYDRNGDVVREKEPDLSEDYNQAAYTIREEPENQEKPICHRRGEAYILENTWVTGEKTPNDPFRNQQGDGQADILKRVPAGVYIMEELQAPKGYLKGFPTGITVEETARMQTAQMVDGTTKLMIGKMDGTSGYTYQILDMQEGRKRGTAVESKSTYGQSQLAGAKLALYEAVRVYTSDLETYPSGTYLKKKTDVPVCFASTDSISSAKKEQTALWVTGDTPLYLEGIPKGEYLLEELDTPEGFVSGEPLEIVVEGTREVQNYMMYNDHTKLEIEKYTWDGSKRLLLNGAAFTLYPALTDSKGQIIIEDGQMQYEEDNPIDSWTSCDGKEYAGFITAFEEMYRDYGTKGRTVAWDYQGIGRKAVYLSHTQMDASAADGKESDFPTWARLRYQTEDGKEIRVTVYGQQEHRQIRDFEFEYQFDYRQLSHVNSHAVSYLTVEGMRRLDYLPSGQAFVLVETEAPPGFARAENLAVYVEDVADIQRYCVLDQEGTLIISKTGEKGDKELAGARLALYRAGDDGSLVQDDSHLAAEWVSGQDGVYTEWEQLNHQIPEGFQPGDLRPHSLRRLPDGTYYLVELQAPEYYTSMPPKKIEFRQQDKISIIRAANVPAEGEIEIRKTDASGNLLPGAVFQLSAYRKSDLTTSVFTRTYSEHGGILTITGLPIGEAEEDGQICPYRYELKELVPPEGYQVNSHTETFEFPPGKDVPGKDLPNEDLPNENLPGKNPTDKSRSSYGPGEPAKQTRTIVNEKTRVLIQKKKFGFPDDEGAEGAFVEGAELAVYAVAGRGEAGKYLYDEASPIFSWTTSRNQPSKVLEGLTAGQTYLLVEKKAPDGYRLMKPIAFIVSMDGRKIIQIDNHMTVITVHSFGQGDSIDAITIHGRYGIKTEMSVTDSSGNEAASWTADGNGHLLIPTEQVREGESYTITETCVYSDGTRECTGRMTRPVFFEKGGCLIPDRTIDQVVWSLTYEDGTEVSSYQPTESMPDQTIENGIAPENPKIVMYNRGGRPGDALKPEQEVFNQITYVNTSGHKADIELWVKAEKGTRIVDAGEGSVEEDGVRFLIKDAEPLECGTVMVVTEIDADSLESRLSAELTIRKAGTALEKVNVKGEKEVPVLQRGRLTVFQELTGSGKDLSQDTESQFEIHLYAENGEELRGRCSYTGSKSGNLKSGETVSLAGNEYITIDSGPFYKNIRYQVKRKEDGCQVESWNTEGWIEEGKGACAGFTKSISNPGNRFIFIKGRDYILTETTLFSDGTRITSSRIQFTLDENAAVHTITGFDREYHVVIGKKEITGEEEIEGAFLQVRNQDGDVLEEWISGREPHRISVVLEEGERYILHEETAPDGYGYASDIVFTISESGGKEQVVMVDRKTDVRIRKTDITGEKEVPGALLQVLDSKGTVIEEWVSGEEPHEIIGRLEAGKEYILREKAAPEGYAYEEDIRFLVSREGKADQVIMKDKQTRVRIRKTDITGENEIPGAVMQIRNREGQVVETWISEEKSHEIVGKLIAGETYILHEEYAPDGYGYAADVVFTVSRDGRTDQVEMRDEQTKAEILKVSSTAGTPLPGARMQLLTVNGHVVEEWTTTEEPHTITGKLIVGSEYRLREIQAPAGYRTLAKDISITVPKDGAVLHVTVENERNPFTPSGGKEPEPEEPYIPEKPHIPEKPRQPEQPEMRIGKILASYGTKLSGRGRFSFGGFDNIPIPKLGDDSENLWTAAVFVFVSSIMALAASGRYRRNVRKRMGKDGRRRKFIRMEILVGICFLSFFSFPKTARAESVSKTGPSEITVTWEPFWRLSEEPPGKIPENYEYEGCGYRLKSCQLISSMTKEKTQDAETSIEYKAVEQADALPEQAEIEVTDEDTGLTVQAELPAVDTVFSNWRWIGGFQFPITVQQYDAGRFYLGDIVVTETGGNPCEGPFAGYEKELLELIGVSPDCYSIELTEWTSKPWTGEDGLVYRQARASGQKYVADCTVTYRGNVILPATPACAWQAVYIKEEAEQEMPEGEQEEKGDGPKSENPAEEASGFAGLWTEYVRQVMRVTIGILFLLGVAILGRCCRKRKKKGL